MRPGSAIRTAVAAAVATMLLVGCGSSEPSASRDGGARAGGPGGIMPALDAVGEARDLTSTINARQADAMRELD